MFDEELDPRTKKPKPRDLERMSIDELEEYTEDLKAEIERVADAIAKKKAHQNAASSIFKN